MRKLGLALAFGVLAAGTVAHAQTGGGSISNITSSASTTATVAGHGPQTFVDNSGVPGVAIGTLPPSGTSYNSFVHVGDSAITFESSNAGAMANSSSTSSVSFDVTNNTGHAATFNSTITAAGLGFYLADTSGGCLYTGCPQATGHTFNELLNGGANVGFNFSVTSQALNSDGFPEPGGPTTLYSLHGSLGMNIDSSLTLFDELSSSTGPAGPRDLLKNFRTTLGDDFNPATGIDAASAIGYAWDATGISFDIGSIQNQTLTYTTTVFSDNSMPCIGDTGVCLVAYSGFGDPVGAAGAVNNAIGSFQGRFGSIAGGAFGSGLIGGLHFGPTTLAIPTFDGSVGSFETAPVPEPATWMTMIAGFGLLGAALRRRRVLAYN